MKRAIIFSALGSDSIPVSLQEALAEKFDVTYIENRTPLPPVEFIKLVMDFHFIALTRRALSRFDEHIISQLPLLEGISTYSTGKEWIDEFTLAKRQIHLLNLSAYCTNSVAETALGLILMQQHKLHLRYLKAMQKIPESISVRGTELIHKRVGIIGFGHIGALIAWKIKNLCHEILINDLDSSKYEQRQEGLIIASKMEIIQSCDIIVLCASQKFEAKEVLQKEDYQYIKHGTVILNLGRKNLLNHQLLVKMVKLKRIEAYIFDDLIQEEDNPDELEYGKIIGTGHTAWYTDGAIQRGTDYLDK